MKSFKIFSFIALLLLVISCSEQKEFNSNQWKNWSESENKPSLRWQMHKDLLSDYELKTYDRNKVLDLLGKPDSETNNNYSYQLGYTGRGINIGTMTITFENDVVTDIKVTDG